MSEQQEPQTEDVEALKARIAELEAENQQLRERIAELEAENERLRETIGKAEDTLKAYVNHERNVAIKSILDKTNWSKDELEKMDLPSLRLILKAVDSVKGTVKNIRSVASSTTENSKLTVGCLYHKPLGSED
jgi:predicted RNase H-like nuclease (RuvC/YqgF family)